MRIKYISTLLMFVIGFIAIGCASISDYLVGTPLIASISNNKEISRVVKEPIVISGSYEVSYLIPTNHLSTPSDIVLNSSGEIFVSEVRGKGISKVLPTGEVSFWANTGVGSYSIAIDSNDNLYSYFFPTGNIYKITPSGIVSALFENNSELQCYNESSIAVDPTANELYIVRNNEVTGYATLYKVVNGSLTALFDHLNYVCAIAFSKEGKFFLGMGCEIQELNLSNMLRRTIARLPENQTVNHHGLALDAAGNIYACAKTKLYKIGQDGIIKYLVSGFYDLEGIDIAADNTIYAVDRATCGVCKISESAGQAEFLVPPSFISTPQAIEFTSDNKLVVTEDETGCFGNYSKEGTFESFVPSIVYMPPLAGLAIDSNDNIYISESAPGFPDRLMLYRKDGGASVLSTELQKPSGLAFFNNELYVAEFDAGRVSKVSSNGNKETYVSGLTHPESIAFDQNGVLYVSDGAAELNDTALYIEKVTADKTITRFAALSGISYIKYDANNNQLLASVSSGEVYKISPDGNASVFVSGLGSPQGIAFDTLGNIYVSDDQIDTVYKLSKPAP